MLKQRISSKCSNNFDFDETLLLYSSPVQPQRSGAKKVTFRWEFFDLFSSCLLLFLNHVLVKTSPFAFMTFFSDKCKKFILQKMCPNIKKATVFFQSQDFLYIEKPH